ncbi:hypothetical protein D082_04080 [Synechocystis sp. PCC 6714]|nr:hypothetical protein D082_04080 [Synechocystis sp. PCC 6714]
MLRRSLRPIPTSICPQNLRWRFNSRGFGDLAIAGMPTA